MIIDYVDCVLYRCQTTREKCNTWEHVQEIYTYAKLYMGKNGKSHMNKYMSIITSANHQNKF